MAPWRFTLLLLTIPALACRPVLAVGWGELLFVAGLLLFLFGLPLWRFWRKWQAFHHQRKKD